MGLDFVDKTRLVFEEVLTYPVGVRKETAARICGGDEALLEEVTTLLVAHDQADDDRKTHPISDDRDGAIQQSLESFTQIPSVGDVIGCYRVLEELGEGGMGKVFKVEWLKVANRVSALKIVHPRLLVRRVLSDVAGNPVKAVVDEFGQSPDRKTQQRAAALTCRHAYGLLRDEARRQAPLEHDGIARLYDVGTTDEGIPFLVTEFVQGEPLNSYCARRGLTHRQRVELLIKTCRAVAVAHDHRTVHCDLKPENVLGHETSDGHQVKVLDFGVAALIDPKRGAADSRGYSVDYAAPEQLWGYDVTTKSDIYALGVMLYELLTGRRPHTPPYGDPQGSPEPFSDWARNLPPASPPSREMRSDDRPLSRWRHWLDQTRDLDAVVLKALAREPEDRYAHVDDLREDLERYLECRPLKHQEGRSASVFHKFLVRNKVWSSIAAVLITAAVLMGWQWSRAALETYRETQKTAVVSSFLVDMLQAPSRDKEGRDVLVIDILKQASDQVDTTFADQPFQRIALRNTMGTTYYTLGMPREAAEQFDGGLAVEGCPDEEVYRLSANLAAARYQCGEFEKSRQAFERAYEAVRNLPDDMNPVLMASYAAVLTELGELEEAERILLEALEDVDSWQAEAGSYQARITVGNNLAWVLQRQGRFSEAAAQYRSVLEVAQEATGEASTSSLTIMSNLATTLISAGRDDEARSILQRALELHLETDPEHPDVFQCMNALGAVSVKLGEVEQGKELIVEALAGTRERRGRDHPMAIACLHGLGNANMHLGLLEEAETQLREALAARKALPAGQPWETMWTQSVLGECLRRFGKIEESAQLQRETVEALRLLHDQDHPQLTIALQRLKAVEADLKRIQKLN